MPRKKAFQMKLADLKPDTVYSGLSFGGIVDDPIVVPIMGRSVEYGPLFAYLFRRFGYPNKGWDNYKELTKYILTTPHQDMLLQVVPYAGGSSSISFTFLVSDEVKKTIRDYDNRDTLAWEQRAFEWREAQGLPEWMPEWIDHVNDTLRPAWGAVGPDVTDWRETLVFAIGAGKPDDPRYQLQKLASELRAALYKDYLEIDPSPPLKDRGADWSKWNDDDPMKPFAEAAVTALQCFHQPVRVRDIAINAFGVVDQSRNILKEPRVAGYPSGALGNKAPEEFADLHELINKLGGGDVRKGIAKLMSIAKDLG